MGMHLKITNVIISKLRNNAEKYPCKAGVKHICKEIYMLLELPQKFQSDGKITHQQDFFDIIQWKAPRLLYLEGKNGRKGAKANSEITIRKVTEEAFNERNVERKVEILTHGLQAVDIPVASAILLFFDPERFTVLDKYAWKALEHYGLIESRKKSYWEASDYRIYLNVCRKISQKLMEYYQLTLPKPLTALRYLDWGLWVKGNELNKDKRN